MNKKFDTLLLIVFIFVGVAGCTVTTSNEGSWELYGGIRTKQIGEEAAKIEIKSSVVTRIVDSLVDGEVSEAE